MLHEVWIVPPPAKGEAIYCSQCGGEFAGDGVLYGYSHCSDHRRERDWPTVEVVPGPKLEVAVQTRPTVSHTAAEYNDRVNRIVRFLYSASAALADNDHQRADDDNHEAWMLMCGLGGLIDDDARANGGIDR